MDSLVYIYELNASLERIKEIRKAWGETKHTLVMVAYFSTTSTHASTTNKRIDEFIQTATPEKRPAGKELVFHFLEFTREANRVESSLRDALGAIVLPCMKVFKPGGEIVKVATGASQLLSRPAKSQPLLYLAESARLALYSTLMSLRGETCTRLDGNNKDTTFWFNATEWAVTDRILRPEFLIIERGTTGLLGAGTYGTVYTCEYMHTKAAIKIFTSQNTSRGRLPTEALVGFQLQHPNLQRMIGIAPTTDGWGIVSELYQPFDPDESTLKKLKWILEAARGLMFMHSRDYAHLDVKPDNILIDYAGNAVVADFGHAALADAFSEAHQPSGTLEYQAPEQSWLEAEEDDMKLSMNTKADVYAFGVTVMRDALCARRWRNEDELMTNEDEFTIALRSMKSKPEGYTYTHGAMGLEAASLRKEWSDFLNSCMRYEPEERCTMQQAYTSLLPLITFMEKGGDPWID